MNRKPNVEMPRRARSGTARQVGSQQKPIYKTPAGEQAVMAVYDRILVTWPDTTERLQIETRHGRTHVLAQGQKDARPLMLLHGAGSNALAWGGDVPEFARHFRVYAVDTPGEPGRSCHERIPWKGDSIVEWLEDVLDGLGVRQALLAGISQGGYIALRFASARPDRVKTMALLAPGGVSQVKSGFLARAVAYGLMGRRGTDALVRHVMGDSEVPEPAMEYMNLIFTHFRSRMDASRCSPTQSSRASLCRCC
jgi:pimeloyl-ACP methyl ester carboxylesterase